MENRTVHCYYCYSCGYLSLPFLSPDTSFLSSYINFHSTFYFLVYFSISSSYIPYLLQNCGYLISFLSSIRINFFLFSFFLFSICLFCIFRFIFFYICCTNLLQFTLLSAIHEIYLIRWLHRSHIKNFGHPMMSNML